VTRLVSQTAKKAGIERGVGVGEIRRTVAHLLAKRGGATLRQIGAFLGIMDTETTSIPMVKFLEG